MRRVNDFYPTESKLTLSMLDFCGSAISGLIKEPCNGQGHISDVLRNQGYEVQTSDIEKDARNAVNWSECDWTITNPPFIHALPILKYALQYSKQGVIFLTRLSFLEPTYDRSELWKKHIPSLVIVNPRTSFTGDGKSDSVTTCWICFGKFKFSGIQFVLKE